ncbi:porin [Paraburkholderia dipogonis]|uniref:porin n=1 Tax=Paraburkholderia dipogonis TaxID=1211383 RepID=UPI0038B74EEE
MKRKLLFCAALSVFASGVHAQSSVTLYGVLDEGVMFQSNNAGGRRVYLDSINGINGSRWGLTGKEDLGGGLRAIFTLESGININNGQFAQGGTPFGRQAWVGLASDSYGSLTFGRQMDMVVYFPSPLSVAGLISTSIFSHPGDIDNTANSIRANNSIRYMSPNYHGFSYGAEYMVGGVAGNVTGNSGYSLGMGYTGGPFSIAAAFEYFKNPTSATAGQGWFTSNANGVSLLAFSLNKGYVSASAYQVGVIAASYKIGPVTLAASGSNIQYANMTGTLAGQTARFNNADIGLTYAYRPDVILGIGYDYLVGKGVQTTKGETIGNQHYNQVAIMGQYILSKRTDVYLAAGYQRATGTSSTGAPAVADFTIGGDSSNNHQFVTRLAIRHKF